MRCGCLVSLCNKCPVPDYSEPSDIAIKWELNNVSLDPSCFFSHILQSLLFFFLVSHADQCLRTLKQVAQSSDPPHNSSYVFFFFYWHYNPLWVIAFSVILFHSALSSHCFLHRLIPIICISSSMSTAHLFLCLPLILVPIRFYYNILLDVPLSSIRITWPSQAILLLFINLTMSAFSISLFRS